MANKDEELLTPDEFILDMELNDSTELLLKQWHDSGYIQQLVKTRSTRKMDIEKSFTTDIGSFSLPIESRPIFPESEMYDAKWTDEIKDSLSQACSVTVFRPASEWQQAKAEMLSSFKIPLLTALCFKGQRGLTMMLSFINVYVAFGFLVADTLMPFVEKGDVEGLDHASKEIVAASTEDFTQAAEGNDISKLKDFARLTFKKLNKCLGKITKKELFLQAYRDGLHEFVDVFRFRAAHKEKRVEFKNYFRQRQKEQHWFSVLLWQKLQNFDAFSDKFLGHFKLLDPLEQLCRLHIAISQDIMRFSRDQKLRSSWNVIFVLEREFALSLEQAAKVALEMLDEVSAKIDQIIRHVETIQDTAFQFYKNGPYSLLKLYCMNSIAAAILWGSTNDYFAY